MKKIFYLFPLFLVFFTISLIAQTPAKYWVQFKDKTGSSYSIDRPQEFLSAKAIENRNRQHIKITEEDLPVNQHYIAQVAALDDSMIVLTKSKWLNGITVYSNKEDIIEKIKQLPFVIFCERTISMKEPEIPIDSVYSFYSDAKPIYSKEGNWDESFYGEALEQLKLNNIHWLHRLGFRGEKMVMMVMDGGFHNVDTLRHFAKMREDNRLLGARNFVLLGENPFREASHGTMVLSCIASYVPGELVGSAPFVAAYVAKTEDGRSENKIEEDNWVAGIEWADSLGCQVLNSSLGYTKFDDSLQTRTYEDLNGKTSRASRAATIAASKGMIVCNSAGNEGTKKWKYIGAPADAEQILSVGAVDINGKRASFSSYGPTADGRIKPDACAVGKNTFVATPRSKTLKSNGTSFSSPILSGMVVCLWQAFPEKSNLEIIDAIRKSGSQIMAPDSSLGYGITDFLRAYNYLNLKENVKNLADFQSFVSHNGKTNIAITTETPTPLTITAKSRKSGKITTKTYDISGKKIINFTLPKLPKNTAYDIIDLTISTPTQSQNYVVGAEQTK